MKTKINSFIYAVFLMLFLASCGASAQDPVLDHSYRPLAGEGQVDLGETYGGQVLLIVNTASKCGFTPQYEGLEGLHERYGTRGFAVLGFPSGDFKEQEFEDEGQ